MDFHNLSQFPLSEHNSYWKCPKKVIFQDILLKLGTYSKKCMLNLIIPFILMYLVNELAKNYLKSLFFNFLNFFFRYWGLFLGGYHGNKFEFLSIFFLIWNIFQNTTKKLVTAKVYLS